MFGEVNNLMSRIWSAIDLELPLFPYRSNENKSISQVNIFSEMSNTNSSWSYLKNMLDDFKNLRNKYLGYNLGNETVYIKRFDKRFKFSFSRSCFLIWDDSDRHLGEYKFTNNEYDNPPTEKFIEWVKKVTKDYCDGIVRCCECGKEINKSEIAGQYFAGIYCKHCWDTKWKAIEAKETYD